MLGTHEIGRVDDASKQMIRSPRQSGSKQTYLNNLFNLEILPKVLSSNQKLSVSKSSSLEKSKLIVPKSTYLG